jgi:hypothetical protein
MNFCVVLSNIIYRIGFRDRIEQVNRGGEE